MNFQGLASLFDFQRFHFLLVAVHTRLSRVVSRLLQQIQSNLPSDVPLHETISVDDSCKNDSSFEDRSVYHISVSRTVPIRELHIQPLADALANNLKTMSRFV